MILIRRSGLFAFLAGLLCVVAATAEEAPSPAASAPAASAPTGGPMPQRQPMGKLQAETEEWKIGEVWQGEKRRTQIKITNVGDAPVTVKKVVSPCACTKGTLEKLTYLPGESGTLVIDFDSKLTKDKYPKKTVQLETDIPLMPFVIIIVNAEIKQLFSFEVEKPFNLGRIEFDQPFTREVRFARNYESNKPLGLKVEPNPWFDLKLDELTPNKVYKLTIRSKNPMPLGFAKASAYLLTDFEAFPEFRLPIDCYVLKAVQVIPDQIKLRSNFLEPSGVVLNVIYRKDTALKVEKVEANFEGLGGFDIKPARAVEFTDRFESVQIIVQVPPPGALPTDRVPTVKLVTSNPEFREIEVPIVITDVGSAAPPTGG
ncbi:MAG: DUF1573 domain-containing protein [Phycisphaerae bacterium]|nr:DUF1573 domain-containing protein [Phycisphaerae bacterium]